MDKTMPRISCSHKICRVKAAIHKEVLERMFGGGRLFEHTCRCLENLSWWKKFLPTEMIKIFVREILSSGVLKIFPKSERIQYLIENCRQIISTEICLRIFLTFALYLAFIFGKFPFCFWRVIWSLLTDNFLLARSQNNVFSNKYAGELKLLRSLWLRLFLGWLQWYFVCQQVGVKENVE